jgi:hypothetical protein
MRLFKHNSIQDKYRPPEILGVCIMNKNFNPPSGLKF